MQPQPPVQRLLLHSATGTTYELGRELGNGGMGKVYLAQARCDNTGTSNGHLVALKILHPNAPLPARRLFYHEGTLLPRLQHAHIATCRERGRGTIGTMGVVDYMALDYIAGETLEELLRRRRQPLPPTVTLGIVAQLVAALGYIHQRGITHCDVKLNNIMLERATPNTFLIDFGIARAPDVLGHPVTVGTPQYMAPEQMNPHAACDGRADIYALGVVVYELLTGKRLFPHRKTTDIRNGLMLVPDPAMLRTDVPEPLAQVITGSLQPNPHDRFQNVEAFFAAMCQAVQQLQP